MPQLRRTATFDRWLAELRDDRAAAKVVSRIDRLAEGNPGDVASVGEGVSEMRIDHGPGYRVYFTRVGREVVFLLAGGDKSTQARDIRAAHQMARDIKERR